MNSTETLILNQNNALRLKCHKTDRTHVSWIVRGEGIPFVTDENMKNQLFFVIFEDIPEQSPSTTLTIEPFTLNKVEDIYLDVYEEWGCDDEKLPDPNSLYGKAFFEVKDSEVLLPVCPACKDFRLREMTPEDAADDRIIAGYLICDQCGGEFHEDDV